MNWPFPPRTDTQYTKHEREDLVKVLKLAKARLWDGSPGAVGVDSFICSALASVRTVDLQIAAREAEREISRRLEDHAILEDWLIEKKVISEWTVDLKLVQQHRHAWLDQLIEEFSA